MSKLTLEETKMIKVLIAQIKALINTIKIILNNPNGNEVGKYTSFRSMAQTYNDLAEHASKLLKVDAVNYTFNMNTIKSSGVTLWSTQKSILEQTLLYANMLLAGLEGSMDFVDDECDNLASFLQTHLRTVIFSVPDKEKEVQNAIEGLLVGRGLSKGLDYDRESGKFMFSGKEYIPDFIIPKMNLCIEVKLLKEGRKSKMVEEISADITAYSKEYQHILFIIYDLGIIQNEIEFKRDIEMQSGVKVVIVKH